MSYVDELAEAIRRSILPQLLPDGDTTALFRMYALLATAKGKGVVLEDVHDAWAAWMTERDPQHQSLKPLEELPADVQRADRPFLEAIRAVARERGLGRRAANARSGRQPVSSRASIVSSPAPPRRSRPRRGSVKKPRLDPSDPNARAPGSAMEGGGHALRMTYASEAPREPRARTPRLRGG